MQKRRPHREDTDATAHHRIKARCATHRRSTDPIDDDLHADTRPRERDASLRDGLRPPLTPDADEQQGWLSGRRLSDAHPLLRTPGAPPS
jgi:hypothetical protein